MVALPPSTQSRTVALTEVLIRQHQAGVWRYLRFLGAAPALADDLTQETFLEILRRAPVDRGAAALGGWLRATARNLFLAQRRRGRFEVAAVPAGSTGAQVGDVIDVQIPAGLVEAARRALMRQAYALPHC